MYNENPIFAKWNADMYDQKVAETGDVDLLLSLIGSAPRRILEVCCGSGRVLVPLARAGHDVSGLDADEHMLAKIPAKAMGLGNISWRAADAVRDCWGQGFDVVVLAGNILYNIVSDMDYAKAQQLFIQKAASALVPGGHVFIDYQPGGFRVMQPALSHKSVDPWVVWEGADADGNFGRMILLNGSYDAATHISRFTRRFELTLTTGETLVQDIPGQKHFATLAQLHGWLKSAGFAIVHEYGDFGGSPVTDDSRGVVIYAVKT